MPARKKICSHILSQSSPDYPPPIWSLLLRFDHSLDWLDFAGFVRFPFIFLMFAVNGSVQNPDIMQCNVIGSGFSTHFSLGVNWGSLMLSRFNFVLVYVAMPSLWRDIYCTQLIYHPNFLRNIEVRKDSEEGGVDPLILQRRAEIKDAFTRLLFEHPALPPEIRHFQVQLKTCSLSFKCIHHRLM